MKAMIEGFAFNVFNSTIKDLEVEGVEYSLSTQKGRL